MKKRHVLGLLLLSVALSHALAPAIAWAQAKAQNVFYSLTVTDTVTASGDVTADQYIASGAASQYSCSKTDGTCQFSSATADGTTSSTVAPFTMKAGANITAADLLLDVQDSAGAHAFTCTEAGTCTALLAFVASGASGTLFDGRASTGGSVIQLANGGGLNFSVADSDAYLLRSASNTIRQGDGATGSFLTGAMTLGKTTGDALTVVGGGYARITFNAGAPTGTDCDAAGEAGRLAVDTANNRFYFCNGAAWQYTNEDVP